MVLSGIGDKLLFMDSKSGVNGGRNLSEEEDFLSLPTVSNEKVNGRSLGMDAISNHLD